MPSGGNFTNCNCGPDTPACAQPTEPVSTVGLCLADGTPIAVTVVRDCAGTVTSEGWINLTSGAWSAGAPPAGTIACGDSRSIQVSGTFCDIDDDGQILGLVLIEYAYAADGSIDSVRLVDAVTGDTYVPQGTVTTCPAGVEQPERDLVQLCDTTDDESGTVVSVPFLRDYARDENGAVVGHSDYSLDGQPYTVTGTAGICPEESDCRDCQTLALCDTPLSTTPAPLLASGTGPQTGTTASGVGWATSSGTSGGNADWFPLSLFPVATTGPFVLTLDRPSAVTWSARVGASGATVGQLIMPPGTELAELSPLHLYDPVTRTLSPAPGAGTATANGESTFVHRGPVTGLTFASDGAGGLAVSQRSVGAFLLAPAVVPFLRTTCRDCTGIPLDSADTLLDGVTPYEPTGTVGVCHPPEAEPCATTVSTMRLCDLNPDAEPDEQGRRCAVPFLRHLVHDCTGALAETRDTAMDGVTAYAPVQVVDCGAGLPAMVEVPWEVTAVELDPEAEIEGRGWLYSLSPVDAPDLVGVMRVTLSSTANTVCSGTPPQVSVHNPTTYRYEPDDVLREHATYIRVDLLDFDNFEPVTGLSPAPNRLGGTAYWDGTTIRPTENNSTGELYYDGPPPSWQFRVGNTGGGTSCSALSFAAVSLRAEGCCAPCGENGGGGTGRTVQEVCVIATGAPADVMRWTRVIEAAGSVIYYLDETGTRYEDTLPAGHLIVACPAQEPDGCASCETITLCDVQPEEESPGAPLIDFTELRLSDLEDGPTSGTLPNGVGYTVSCGSWLTPQAHYTIYPVGGPGTPACDQVWTFDQPVYLRFGVRGFNVSPRECISYEADGGASFSIEFLHPNHRLGGDPDSICGLGSATDESVVRTDGPVTELTIRATTNAGAGRGLGLLHVGLLADPQPEPGAVIPFLRTTCRACGGAVISTADTTLEGQPYTPAGLVTACATGSGDSVPGRDVEILQLCDAVTGEDPVPFLRHLIYTDGQVPPLVADTELDGVTPYTLAGDASACAEQCRDTSSTLLCDTSAADLITVFDPANVAGPDGWEVVSFTGERPGAGPEAPMPYPARHGSPYGYPALGARDDQYAGYGGGSWAGYDAAPVRWVLRKTFIAPEDGVATAQSIGFRGDGGARVRINGIDGGMYGQWNQPATSGTAEIPVTAGPNIVEIEVRDVNGINNVVGRLDIAMPRTVQFLRRQVTDCATGQVIETTDTTLDGEPYEVAGEVGQCQTTSECCEQPPPELRVDVESDVLCIRGADGENTGQVIVERVYDDQSGDLLVQRLTDPATGEEVELPAGADLVVCQEPACPVAFSTECVGVVERTEASYDNTSMIGGVPGQCGGVQGPGGQFPCQPTGPLTITSWIVNGEEVIGDGGRAFNGGPCGDGTAAAPGMHRNWSAALTNLDPSGATWSAQTQPACAWYVGSTGGTQTTYGPMVVEDAAGQQWTLTPAQSCQETQFTKVYTQQCDGSVSVSWLDADGEETTPPDGEQVPCGTGCGTGGGRGLDVEPLLLCDIAGGGPAVQFLRHFSYGSAGQVIGALDTALDGFTPYTPVGTVTVCQPDPAPDVEVVQLCDTVDGDPVPFLRHLVYTGEAGAPTVLDTALDGTTPYAVAGTVGACPEPCAVRAVIEQCRYDDTDGDGVADETYVELLGVDCEGALTSLGTYTQGLTEPYAPVAPVDPPEDGPDPVTLVEPHRVELAPGQSWSAASVTLLQAVTATAHGGTGQIATAGGTSTLYEGESVSWSVIRDGDTSLTGPLTITAGPGTVTVSYTRTTTS